MGKEKILLLAKVSLSIIFGGAYTGFYIFHKYINPDWNLAFIFSTGGMFMYLILNNLTNN